MNQFNIAARVAQGFLAVSIVFTLASAVGLLFQGSYAG